MVDVWLISKAHCLVFFKDGAGTEGKVVLITESEPNFVTLDPLAVTYYTAWKWKGKTWDEMQPQLGELLFQQRAKAEREILDAWNNSGIRASCVLWDRCDAAVSSLQSDLLSFSFIPSQAADHILKMLVFSKERDKAKGHFL